MSLWNFVVELKVQRVSMWTCSPYSASAKKRNEENKQQNKKECQYRLNYKIPQ